MEFTKLTDPFNSFSFIGLFEQETIHKMLITKIMGLFNCFFLIKLSNIMQSIKVINKIYIDNSFKFMWIVKRG